MIARRMIERNISAPEAGMSCSPMRRSRPCRPQAPESWSDQPMARRRGRSSAACSACCTA
jgi:hypothetical protein